MFAFSRFILQIYKKKTDKSRFIIKFLISLHKILHTELSHVGKLREVREVRGKLRDKCPKFKLEDYCLLTSRTTVGSDNFFNFP